MNEIAPAAVVTKAVLDVSDAFLGLVL